MDRRDTGRVDLLWDIEWIGEGKHLPLADGTVDKLLLSHIVEHLKPWLMVSIMDEFWRVMHPDGQCLIATPYAGSAGFWQDPTHTKGWNEATPAYWDPTHQSLLWNVYRPRPWKIVRCHHSPFHNMEIVLEPLKAPLCCTMCGREGIPLDDFEEHWGPCYRKYKGIEDRANEEVGTR